ncbi:Supervillin, partial [Frankliniella fusca]
FSPRFFCQVSSTAKFLSFVKTCWKTRKNLLLLTQPAFRPSTFILEFEVMALVSTPPTTAGTIKYQAFLTVVFPQISDYDYNRSNSNRNLMQK